MEGYYSDSPVGDVLTVAHTREENYLSFPYQFLEEATRLIGGVSVTVETNSCVATHGIRGVSGY